MKKENAISIIVALIGVIGTIAGAVIGVIWGKSNVNVIVQLDGKNVVLEDTDVQELASENEELRKQISDNEAQIENLKNESKDLLIKLGDANGELEGIPSIEFRELGLSIDGEEKAVNKEKASVFINGNQYYSKDFIDNLIPDNMSVTEKDNMFYIGKIVKEKTNLFDRPIIEKGSSSDIFNSIEDSYGNTYYSALVISNPDNFTTFNVGREYSHLKCTVAMRKSYSNHGELQIKADGDIVYTSSDITRMTEPFEIDIPINQASTISVGTISDSYSGIIVTNAVLYNQE